MAGVPLRSSLRRILPLLLMAGLVLAVLGLRRAAWQIGYRGDVAAHYSLGNLTRFGVPAVGVALLIWFLEMQQGAHSLIARLVLASSLVFACISCLGHYYFWPLGLVAVAAALIAALFSRERGRLMRLGHALAVSGLFVLACYLAASISMPFLRGYAQRLEERVGSERLLEWGRQAVALEAVLPPAKQPGGADLPWRWYFMDPLTLVAGMPPAGSPAAGGPWHVLGALVLYREGEGLPRYLWPPFMEAVFPPKGWGLFRVNVSAGPKGRVTILDGPTTYYYVRIIIDPAAAAAGRQSGDMIELRPGVSISTQAPPK